FPNSLFCSKREGGGDLLTGDFKPEADRVGAGGSLMDRHQIDIPVLGLKGYHFASPQRSGALTVLPLFGREHTGRFAPPLSGLKLAGVKGYGNITLENAMDGVAIVPLHIGYIQDQAQNHAL